MTPFPAAVAAPDPGGIRRHGDPGGRHFPKSSPPASLMKAVHVLAALLLAPVAVAVSWPLTWILIELHRLIHS